ncbi:DNA-directed DNA polymerase [Pseudomonas baetica]|uniref:Y-family DNA polymerase n=1 Tax=Pseudomonas baetica TaxID=674054 RepID=UPI002406DAC2|nr:DNA-directed DNA polymerase [Pseudomonas baetica]
MSFRYNDGNAISRSQEAKNLGIKMAQPFHEIKGLADSHGVIFRSSNFPLYQSCHHRLIQAIGSHAPCDIYSIDKNKLHTVDAQS